jgi:hypothetical protein
MKFSLNKWENWNGIFFSERRKYIFEGFFEKISMGIGVFGTNIMFLPPPPWEKSVDAHAYDPPFEEIE